MTQYKYRKNISAFELDTFVQASEMANLLQGSQWHEIKDGWAYFNLGFYQENDLAGVASVLVRPLPFGMSAFYIPRGPITDYTNKDLVDYIFDVIRKEAKAQNALFVKYDPAITKDYLPNLNRKYWSGETRQMSETIQPRFQAVLTQDSLANLSKSTRQNIRTAKNKGIETVHGGMELLDDFADLMEKTAKRKDINLRNKAYFKKILETYDDAYITMSYLDIPSRIKVCEKKVEEKRFAEELAFLSSKQPIKTPLSATLTVPYGDTSDNLYAGMDNDFHQYQSAAVTWYETAKYAFDKGIKTHNLGGIENNLQGPLYKYKSKFKPEVEEYVGEFTMPTSPIYPLFNLAYKLRKALK